MTENGTVGITFFKTSRSTFSRKLTGSINPLVFKLSVKNFSNRKTISECIVKYEGWSQTSNLGWFFILVGALSPTFEITSCQHIGDIYNSLAHLRPYPSPLVKRKGILPVKHKHKHVVSCYWVVLWKLCLNYTRTITKCMFLTCLKFN